MRSVLFTVTTIFILFAAVVYADFDSGQCAFDDSTLALWHSDEGTGTVLADATGNNHAASLIGLTKPQWASPGLFGGKGLFLTYGYNNSPNKYGAIQLDSGLLNHQNLTLEMYVNWVYQSVGANPSDYGSLGYLVNDGTNMYVKTYMDYSVPPFLRCKLIFGVQTSAGLLEISTPGTYSLQHEMWTQAAFTREYSGGNTTIKIYINGQLAVTGSKAGTPVMGGGFAQIGSTIYNTVSWGGDIDDIRLSDVARTTFCNGSLPRCGDWGKMGGDLNSNCYLDLFDLLLFAQYWLNCSGGVGDINHSGCVNFSDFSILSDTWLTCTDPCNSTVCNYAYDEVVDLENEHYLCQLSVGSGLNTRSGLRWLRLFNKNLQTEYLNKETQMPLFMVFGDGFVVDSTDFIIGSVTKSQTNGIWQWHIPMTCSSQQLTAELVVNVDGTEKMNWALNVNNTAASTRKLQPVFPVMGRVDIGNSLADNHYFVPWRSGIVGKIDCDLKYEYGNLAWMQVFSVFNPTIGAGLYTYPMDSNGGFKGMLFKKSYAFGTTTVKHAEVTLPRERPYISDVTAPTDLLAGVIKGIGFTYYYPRISVAAGGQYALPQTVIGVYQGGWKEALKDYSTWAHTWYTHVDTPQWLKNCFNSVGGWPGWYCDSTSHTYTRSQTMHDPDPMHLEQWYGWWDGWEAAYAANSPFHGAGDFYYNELRGGLTAFKNEIETIQAKGSRMTVYIDNRFCWDMTDIGQLHGQAWAVMDPPGVYATYQRAEDKWMMCSYEPNAWVDWLSQTCGRIVRDTGMDGIYLDELPLMFPCYNTNHVHYQQDGAPFSVDRMRQFLTKSRNAMRQENPEAILMTEHAGSDYFTQFYDSSWSQTYYKAGFPFAEQYFDEDSLNYFRFCFPEFKLLEWGPADDWERRTFFNGIGICDYPLSGISQQAGQVMKENGDVFASLSPEPLVATKIARVLANKFPIANKVLYTIYNKTADDFNIVPVIEIERKTGYHYVELYNDSNAIGVQASDGNDILSFRIKANTVLCLAQLPQIIAASKSGSTVNVSLSQSEASDVLVAFFNCDRSAWGYGDGVVVSLTSGQGQFSIPAEYVNAKIILKLVRNELLIDELILDEQPAAAPGTIVLWHLDETSGNIGYDSAGMNNNLVKGATYSWQSANGNTSVPPSRGLRTPSSSCDTYCTSWINPEEITDALTVSLWAKFTSVDPNGTYLMMMDSKFMIRVDGGRSSVQFLVLTPDDVWHQVDAEPMGAGATIVGTGWHLISGVYDGKRDANGNANLYFYWDGMLKKTVSFPISAASQPLMSGGSGKVIVGGTAWNELNTSLNFVGSIDEVTVKNVLP